MISAAEYRAQLDRDRSEDDHQIAVVEWARAHGLDLLHHSPNQSGLPPKIAAAVGRRNKRMGTVDGWPDLQLPIGRAHFNSLFVELKRPGGRVTRRQAEIHEGLRGAGNRVVVAYGADEAIQAIQDYLDLN